MQLLKLPNVSLKDGPIIGMNEEIKNFAVFVATLSTTFETEDSIDKNAKNNAIENDKNI